MAHFERSINAVITIPCYTIFAIFSAPGMIRPRNSQSIRAGGRRREFCSRLCSLSRAGMPPSHAHATRVYSLFYKCLYTSHRLGCHTTHTVAHTLTRCFITVDLAGARTRNDSLITTATAINPGRNASSRARCFDLRRLEINFSPGARDRPPYK